MIDILVSENTTSQVLHTYQSSLPRASGSNSVLMQKEMNMKRLLVGMLFAPMAFGANVALADGWPTSVAGNWDIVGNHSPGTLNITSQGNAGDCQPIGGTIYNDSIHGFYCPHSGRIHFIRSNGGGAFEVFSGNLSQVGRHFT